ncbi:hypothetical protein ACFQ1Q_06900 [Winogradskyella litorisediminis]|uniref:Uncharacterized protein n=1 Tax=Winogradskyella litorisediminis TaxID=1156618 RepID=A0ABW3N8P6_9FLAO
MKALKITLLLIAVVVLTVSVVSKENAVQDEVSTFKNSKKSYNPIVHAKKKRGVSSNG